MANRVVAFITGIIAVTAALMLFHMAPIGLNAAIRDVARSANNGFHIVLGKVTTAPSNRTESELIGRRLSLTPPDTTRPLDLSTNYRHLILKPLDVGDTIIPAYSITTDTVLRVVGYAMVAKKCGISHYFLRLRVRGVVIHADSVTVPVCFSQWWPAGGDTTRVTPPVGDTTKSPPNTQ